MSSSPSPEVAIMTGGLTGKPIFHGIRISSDYSKDFQLRLLQNRVDFYFDEHAVVNQAPHFNHGRARPDVAKKFTVSAPKLFPPRDVGDEHPRPHDIFQTRPESGERPFDIADYLNRLRVSVPDAYDFAALVGRGRTGDEDLVADANCARIADDRLPFRIRRIVLLFSHDFVNRA